MTTGFFTQQYRRVLDYASDNAYTMPDIGTQIADNARIKEMIRYGLWDMEDLMYFLNRGSSEFSRINYKNPSSFYATLISTPSWGTSGFTGTATAGLNTNWTPSSQAVNAEIDFNSTTMRITTSGQDNNYVCGANHSSLSRAYIFNPCRTNEISTHNNNSGTLLQLYDNPSLTSLGRWTVGRAAPGSNLYLARDSTMLLNPGGIGAGATGWPDRPFYVLGWNDGGTYSGSTRRMSFFSVGYHKTSSEIAHFHSLIP